MLFGKHLNRYYLRYGWRLLLGILVLVMEDVLILQLPEKYQLVVNGLTAGNVQYQGETVAFDLTFLLDVICMPMLIIILTMLVGRLPLFFLCFHN